MTTTTPSKPRWRLEAAFKGNNADGHNKGGLAFYLVTPGGTREEVGRVAIERDESKYPDRDYDTQVNIYLDKARNSLIVINELSADAGELM